MDYSPRYPQPFTLSQALRLDVPIITEEITRLQNSLMHLKSTQEQLREANKEAHDPDFEQAIQENEDVIGSQEERVSILKMALADKGISTSDHYSLEPSLHAGPGVDRPTVTQTNISSNQSQQSPEPQRQTAQSAEDHSHEIVIDEDGGIDL